MLPFFSDAALPYFCNVSLINGLGYIIDDFAITASSSYPADVCQSSNSRYIEVDDTTAWCSGITDRKCVCGCVGVYVCGACMRVCMHVYVYIMLCL